MKRIISALLCLFVCFFLAIGVAQGSESSDDCSDQEAQFAKLLEKYCKTVNNYTYLDEIFAEIPCFESFLKKPWALDYLYSRTYDAREADLESINILIVYIENSYRITALDELRSMSTTYTSITITTRSNKHIYGLRLAGTDNAVPYQGTITGATPISGTQTYAYNCHSYAWYYGGNYNSSDKMWINNPQPYSSGEHCHTCIEGYTPLTDIAPSDIHAGDIIVYFIDNEDDEMIDPSTFVWAHSAIVDHVTSSGKIWVRSKWGSHEVFNHRVDKCPYYTGFINGVAYSRNLAVYRPNHSIESVLIANQNYYLKNSTLHYKCCYYCGRHITSGTEAHTFTSVQGVPVCLKCGYYN